MAEEKKKTNLIEALMGLGVIYIVIHFLIKLW